MGQSRFMPISDLFTSQTCSGETCGVLWRVVVCCCVLLRVVACCVVCCGLGTVSSNLDEIVTCMHTTHNGKNHFHKTKIIKNHLLVRSVVLFFPLFLSVQTLIFLRSRRPPLPPVQRLVLWRRSVSLLFIRCVLHLRSLHRLLECIGDDSAVGQTLFFLGRDGKEIFLF